MKIIFLSLITAFMLSSCGLPPQADLPDPPAMIAETQAASPTIVDQPVSGVPTIEPTLQEMQLSIYPNGSRTGSSDLDPIIDAVLSHDFSAIKELTEYSRIGCTLGDGLGGPPKCETGEGEGTIVEVVPFLGPEGHHSRKADYEKWEGPDVLGLRAAYSTSEGTYDDPNFPAGEYALVFLLAGGPQTLTLQVSEGRIVRYDYHIGGQTASDLESIAAEMLLPILSKPVPTQFPWKNFTDPESRFSFLYPPSLELLPADHENSWHLGNRIRIEILSFERSWITCFYESTGDCPFVEIDQNMEINGRETRRIEGYLGAVGGYTPQEFLTHIFNLGDQALVLTVYALPFGTQPSDPGMIWPLEGMELELFERIIRTVILN